MLSHSFDQFYIVTKFELPKTKDLRLATFKFDFECSYANHTSSNTNYAKLLKYCMKIMPYAQLYQRQIQYYNQTAYDTLTNDIGKILPIFLTNNRQKHGAILASILGSVASSVIGLVGCPTGTKVQSSHCYLLPHLFLGLKRSKKFFKIF